MYDYPHQWNDVNLIIQIESSFFNLQPKQFRYNDDYIFSEKIWKPLITKKPFVTMSENDEIYRHLEFLGFKTFLKYTSEPIKINSYVNKMEQTDSIIKKHSEITFNRVKSFLDNMDNNRENIASDVNHNYKTLLKLKDKHWNRICDTCADISKYDADDFCHLLISTHLLS